MKKYIVIILLSIIVLLLLAIVIFWWNPFNWFKKNPVQKIPATEEVIPELTNSIPEKTEKVSAPVVKKCNKSEINLSKLPPEGFIVVDIDEPMKEYFRYVVASNPPLSNLISLRKLLTIYQNNIYNDPDPFGAYSDENGNRISYSYDELNSIDASLKPLYDQYIKYIDGWIETVDKMIIDKKDNNCLDGALN